MPLCRSATLTLICALPLMLTACAKNPGADVTLYPTGQEPLAQHFNQAYITTSQAGEYDVIFTDAVGDDSPKKPSPSKPLQPLPTPAVRQVVHIHLFWQPMTGTTRNPAAINSSIDYYVIGEEGTPDLLLYQGAGLVALDSGGQMPRLRIRQGNMTLKIRRGAMKDPLGSFNITAEARAVANSASVQDALTELHQASTEKTSASNP